MHRARFPAIPADIPDTLFALRPALRPELSRVPAAVRVRLVKLYRALRTLRPTSSSSKLP